LKAYAFHRAAQKEYGEAAKYYAKILPELGMRFYDEIERLILAIRQNPDRYRAFDSPIRRHFSSVFPYAVLYVDQPDRVLIIAVMHMKRLPGYWRKRLPH
jgi:plasmid stabilization system protein ParE